MWVWTSTSLSCVWSSNLLNIQFYSCIYTKHFLREFLAWKFTLCSYKRFTTFVCSSHHPHPHQPREKDFRFLIVGDFPHQLLYKSHLSPTLTSSCANSIHFSPFFSCSEGWVSWNKAAVISDTCLWVVEAKQKQKS